MTKASVFELSHQLRPFIQKQNTKYRLAIPVVVRVACTLLKLAHATNTRLCSELFAIGMSTVSNVIHDTCRAIDIALHHEIAWPTGNRLLEVQNDFKVLCGLPAVCVAWLTGNRLLEVQNDFKVCVDCQPYVVQLMVRISIFLNLG
jgi:hypothetical protein